MKKSEEIKKLIRKFATDRDLYPQEVLQMYLFERILERLESSIYCNNFILKGGLLISSIIGISERTTMDMDTTIRGIQMNETEIIKVFKTILAVNVNDGIDFEYNRIESIREVDCYNNFRVHVNARFGKINCPMKIDITTGDIITPDAVQYDYPLLFEDRKLLIMAYTLETIIAEKFETIIHRNIGTTRARDFYDLYMLYHGNKYEINLRVLSQAIEHTAMNRGTFNELRYWSDILQDIRDEPYLYTLWDKYISKNVYASKLSFNEVINTIEEIAISLKL